MNFEENKKSLTEELEQFIQVLGELLPRYEQLTAKSELSSTELKELGDLEYLLIDVNARINEIKSSLDQHLFGHTLDLYYKFKEIAKTGDLYATQKVNRLKDLFTTMLLDENHVRWN